MDITETEVELGAKSEAPFKDKTSLMSSHHEYRAKNSLYLPDLTYHVHQNILFTLLREVFFLGFLRGISK